MQPEESSPATITRRGLAAGDARDLCRRALETSQADEARVSLESGWHGFTRSADNRITTAGGSTDTRVTILSAFGLRQASVTSNRIDPDGLAEAVRRSEELARLAPQNPETMPELGPQAYDTVSAYYDATGDVGPEPLAAACAQAIDTARSIDARAAGFIDVRAGTQSIATSNGLFAHHPATAVASTLTVRTADGASSGWAGDEAADWRQIETQRIVADAAAKCQAWRGRTSLDPGRYTVVLEPTAVGMLLLRLLDHFDARQADEGRSFFADPGGGNRIGQELFDPRITLRSAPAYGDAETAPFDASGVARRPEVWIDRGVLRALSYSRFWAERQGVDVRPAPANLIVDGGSDSQEEMIASTARGVLITRFWYIRGLNPRTMAYTGLTRDGTFLIEKGRITRPVNNFRFNQSLAALLTNVETIGAPVRVPARESSSVGAPIVAPPMKIRDFELSSISDAI